VHLLKASQCRVADSHITVAALHPAPMASSPRVSWSHGHTATNPWLANMSPASHLKTYLWSTLRRLHQGLHIYHTSTRTTTYFTKNLGAGQLSSHILLAFPRLFFTILPAILRLGSVTNISPPGCYEIEEAHQRGTERGRQGKSSCAT
jgi:hypothetical protein